MDIKVNIKELVDYRDYFLDTFAEYRIWLDKFLTEQADSFVQSVKRRTPVDTGNLKSRWVFLNPKWSGDTLTVEVWNSAYYASFVEYGHAKPYKSGAQEHSDDWVEGYFMMTITEEEISRAIPKRWEKPFMTFLKQGGIY